MNSAKTEVHFTIPHLTTTTFNCEYPVGHHSHCNYKSSSSYTHTHKEVRDRTFPLRKPSFLCPGWESFNPATQQFFPSGLHKYNLSPSHTHQKVTVNILLAHYLDHIHFPSPMTFSPSLLCLYETTRPPAPEHFPMRQLLPQVSCRCCSNTNPISILHFITSHRMFQIKTTYCILNASDYYIAVHCTLFWHCHTRERHTCLLSKPP